MQRIILVRVVHDSRGIPFCDFRLDRAYDAVAGRTLPDRVARIYQGDRVDILLRAFLYEHLRSGI
jgi:hypothetical protein